MSEKVKIYSKNIGFSGTRLVGTDEIHFKDGVASCTKKQADALVAKGGYFKDKPAEEKPETVVDVDTQKLIDDANTEAAGIKQAAEDEAEQIKTDANTEADEIKAQAENMVYEKAREIIVASVQAKDKKFLKNLATDIKAYTPPEGD